MLGVILGTKRDKVQIVSFTWGERTEVCGFRQNRIEVSVRVIKIMFKQRTRAAKWGPGGWSKSGKAIV